MNLLTGIRNDPWMAHDGFPHWKCRAKLSPAESCAWGGQLVPPFRLSAGLPARALWQFGPGEGGAFSGHKGNVLVLWVVCQRNAFSEPVHRVLSFSRFTVGLLNLGMPGVVPGFSRFSA